MINQILQSLSCNNLNWHKAIKKNLWLLIEKLSSVVKKKFILNPKSLIVKIFFRTEVVNRSTLIPLIQKSLQYAAAQRWRSSVPVYEGQGRAARAGIISKRTFIIKQVLMRVGAGWHHRAVLKIIAERRAGATIIGLASFSTPTDLWCERRIKSPAAMPPSPPLHPLFRLA